MCSAPDRPVSHYIVSREKSAPLMWPFIKIVQPLVKLSLLHNVWFVGFSQYVMETFCIPSAGGYSGSGIAEWTDTNSTNGLATVGEISL